MNAATRFYSPLTKKMNCHGGKMCQSEFNNFIIQILTQVLTRRQITWNNVSIIESLCLYLASGCWDVPRPFRSSLMICAEANKCSSGVCECRSASLGFGLQAGQDGEDEVPKRRVLGDEEARWVCVCVLEMGDALLNDEIGILTAFNHTYQTDGG